MYYLNSGLVVFRPLHGQLVGLLVSCDVAVRAYPVNKYRVVLAMFGNLAFDCGDELEI